VAPAVTCLLLLAASAIGGPLLGPLGLGLGLGDPAFAVGLLPFVPRPLLLLRRPRGEGHVLEALAEGPVQACLDGLAKVTVRQPAGVVRKLPPLVLPAEGGLLLPADDGVIARLGLVFCRFLRRVQPLACGVEACVRLGPSRPLLHRLCRPTQRHTPPGREGGDQQVAAASDLLPWNSSISGNGFGATCGRANQLGGRTGSTRACALGLIREQSLLTLIQQRTAPPRADRRPSPRCGSPADRAEPHSAAVSQVCTGSLVCM
jgi:hypothetical protein